MRLRRRFHAPVLVVAFCQQLHLATVTATRTPSACKFCKRQSGIPGYIRGSSGQLLRLRLSHVDFLLRLTFSTKRWYIVSERYETKLLFWFGLLGVFDLFGFGFFSLIFFFGQSFRSEFATHASMPISKGQEQIILLVHPRRLPEIGV